MRKERIYGSSIYLFKYLIGALKAQQADNKDMKKVFRSLFMTKMQTVVWICSKTIVIRKIFFFQWDICTNIIS